MATGSYVQPQALQENVLTTRYRTDYSGGVNYLQSANDIPDNCSPNATDVDFKAATSVGTRFGYRHLALIANTGKGTGTLGLAEYHNPTTGLNQILRFYCGLAPSGAAGFAFASNGNGQTQVLGWSDQGNGGGVLYNYPIDFVEANNLLYTFCEKGFMYTWDGATFAVPTGSKLLQYGAYYDGRLWGKSPTTEDLLYYSTQLNDATLDAANTLSFTTQGTNTSKPGSLSPRPGGGLVITGLKVFKNVLYVFTRSSIFAVTTTTTLGLYKVDLYSGSLGCVSHRSIAETENDVYFASDTGVYSLGEVGTFQSSRLSPKSLPVQPVYDGLNAAQKACLVGKFFNYKYHLFYSLAGTINPNIFKNSGQPYYANDACLVADMRFQTQIGQIVYPSWQDWRSMPGSDACIFRDGQGNNRFFFGDSFKGEAYEMYSGYTNDGAPIYSEYNSKLFDEQLPDIEKLYFDQTPVFGQLNGTVKFAALWEDQTSPVTVTLSQGNPQGGFGSQAYGRLQLGEGGLGTTVPFVPIMQNIPKRVKAKAQKFSTQFRVTSTGGVWRLDNVGQALQGFNRYKFPSTNKLN